MPILYWENVVFKNLDGEAFGITGRQNEVIELALSYQFKGINVDIGEMLSRAKASGQEFATRYIESAKIRIGAFKLPIKLTGDKEAFQASLEKLRECCELAKVIKATRCLYELEPASGNLPYHENFELHRERLGVIADMLKEYGIHLGIGFNAIPKRRQGKTYEFIFEAEPTLTLIRTIGRPNVGLFLDLWQWVLGDGGMDQLSELKADQIVAVKLADIPDDADLSKISPEQRLLPGTAEGSKCVEALKALHAMGYEGPITPGQSPSQFSRMPRETMVQRTREAMDNVLEKAGIIAPRRIMPVVVAPVVEEEEVDESLEVDFEDAET